MAIVIDIVKNDYGFLKPKITKEDIILNFQKVVQGILDDKARAYRFDDIKSASAYAGYENDFQEIGEAFGRWAASTWNWGNQLLLKYLPMPIEDIPPIEEILKGMPQPVLPTYEEFLSSVAKKEAERAAKVIVESSEI